MITFENFNKHVVQLNIHKCDNLLWFCLFLFLIVLDRRNKYFYYKKLYFRWKSRHRICCLQKAELWRLYSFYHGKTPLSPPWGKRSARVCENGGSHSTCVPREIQPELKMELTTIWASLKTLNPFFSGTAEDHGPGLPCMASGSFCGKTGYFTMEALKNSSPPKPNRAAP